MQRLILILGLIVGMAIGGGCSTNPATGQSQFNILSTAQEIALGRQAAPQFLKSYGGEIPAAAVTRYVRNLGHRLAAKSERPELPWAFYVVDSSVINAFALPGGKVFITRGLLSKLENEAQLAGVLGHEIGHVTAQHTGQQMSRALALQGAAIGLGLASKNSDEDWLRVLGVGTQVGGTLFLLKFGRDQESQSDELGLRYMTRLGYNPVGQLQVMAVFQAARANKHRLPEFLSTHPLPATRIDRLEQQIHSRYPDYQNPSAYRFHADRYKETVLDELERLPPPKHGSTPKK